MVNKIVSFKYPSNEDLDAMTFQQKREEIEKDVKRIQEEVGQETIKYEHIDNKSKFTLSDLTKFYGSVDQAAEEIGITIEAPKSLHEV